MGTPTPTGMCLTPARPPPATPRDSAGFDFNAPYELRALEVRQPSCLPACLPAAWVPQCSCCLAAPGPQPARMAASHKAKCPAPHNRVPSRRRRLCQVALATAVNVLDREVFELEREAYPSVGGWVTNQPARPPASLPAWLGWVLVVRAQRPSSASSAGRATEPPSPLRSHLLPPLLTDRLAVDVSKGVLEDVRRVKSTLNKLQVGRRTARAVGPLPSVLSSGSHQAGPGCCVPGGSVHMAAHASVALQPC